jgi:hypothetical protein
VLDSADLLACWPAGDAAPTPACCLAPRRLLVCLLQVAQEQEQEWLQEQQRKERQRHLYQQQVGQLFLRCPAVPCAACPQSQRINLAH